MSIKISENAITSLFEVKDSTRALVTVTPDAEVILANDLTMEEAIIAINQMALSLAEYRLTTHAHDPECPHEKVVASILGPCCLDCKSLVSGV